MHVRVSGSSAEGLPAPVQRFHRLHGEQTLHGQVEVEAPESLLARLLALCQGAPRGSSRGRLRFTLHATSDHETWTRHFPTQTMRSTLRRSAIGLEEQLGLVRLCFRLHAREQGLSMELVQLKVFGLPCSRWLMPNVIAEECGKGERFCFHIQASVPMVGRVASYRGHLELPQERVA
jgi:Domain of unknown function (DUF4166)